MDVRHTSARTLACALLGVIGLAACGSDDATDADSTESTQTAGTTGADAAPSDSAEADEATEPDGNSDASPGGQGTATLSLDNGETYEFGVLCSLEPQMAAGSEILFTATSYDDPSLDITQFGDEGTVTGLSTVSVYDATSFDSLWGASTIYEPFGGTLELSLDGSTITGTGTFFAGDDPGAFPDGVGGQVVANC